MAKVTRKKAFSKGSSKRDIFSTLPSLLKAIHFLSYQREKLMCLLMCDSTASPVMPLMTDPSSGRRFQEESRRGTRKPRHAVGRAGRRLPRGTFLRSGDRGVMVEQPWHTIYPLDHLWVYNSVAWITLTALQPSPLSTPQTFSSPQTEVGTHQAVTPSLLPAPGHLYSASCPHGPACPRSWILHTSRIMMPCC